MTPEELNDLRDKVNTQHNSTLRTMLGLNELPEFLVKRYFAVKRPLDKIDGRLTSCDLLRIAMDCGLNLETLKFNDGDPHTFNKEDTERLEKTSDSSKIIKNGQSVKAFTSNGKCLTGKVSGHTEKDEVVTYTILTEDDVIVEATGDNIEVI